MTLEKRNLLIRIGRLEEKLRMRGNNQAYHIEQLKLAKEKLKKLEEEEQ